MAETLLADCSQWQPSINDGEYARWSKAIIIRAAYGIETDGAWYNGQRRAALHAAGVKFMGIYGYLVASQSATAQAAALVHLLGELLPGEIPVCDLEEGTDCVTRWQQWCDVILTAYPHLRDTPVGRPWLYSGEDFAAANGLHPDWIAAYSDTEPSQPHILWQFSQTYDVPGIGYPVDCSLYHGSVDELAALTAPQAAPPKPKPAPAEEDDAMAMLESGTDAVTAITCKGGTQTGIGFGGDPGLTGAPEAVLRVACWSNAHGYSQIVESVKVGNGRATVDFTEGDVSVISVMRVAGNEAADNAPLAWSWQ